MAQDHSNSAVAPAVAAIIGVILVFTGNVFMVLLGAFLLLGGGILFAVRVIAVLAKKTRAIDE